MTSSLLMRFITLPLLAILSLALAAFPANADSSQSGPPRTVTTSAGSLTITAWTDGARRDKYVVRGEGTRNVWYSMTGSANAGAGETGRHTSKNEWCRVRYLYGDSVRIPECWGSFMYSSHLITALDGTHYELWFSPSSLSYFKIRNQETGIWYAHDGSANDGRLNTSKDDWCRIIFYHMSGIIKRPKECDAFAKVTTDALNGKGSPAAQATEQVYVARMLGVARAFGPTVNPEKKAKLVGTNVARVTAQTIVKNAAGDSIKRFAVTRFGTQPAGFGANVGAGVVARLAVDGVKDAAGLHAKDANAGAIAGEVVATTAATSALTGAILAASGASLNPVLMGVGALVAGGAAAGEKIAEASEDTGIRFEDGGMQHPRYNRDLNGISEVIFAQKNPPGTFKWVKCADEGGHCGFMGLRSVLYASGDKFVESAFIDGASCTTATAGRGTDPMPYKVKECYVQQLNWDLVSNYFIKASNNAAIFFQQGIDQHCLVPHMDVMNIYGGLGSVRVVANLELKGKYVGACALPNGFFKHSGNPTIYYNSGPDKLARGTPDRPIGSRICAVPSMAWLNAMGGGSNFTTVADGISIGEHRRNMGACDAGRWARLDKVSLRDVGDGWAVTNTPVGNDHQIVKWDETFQTWEQQTGAAHRIGGTYDEPWVMTLGGVVFGWQDDDWSHKPGKSAKDVGAGWIVSTEPTPGGFRIYRWDYEANHWENIPGGGVRIGGSYEAPWLVNDIGHVFEFHQGNWIYRDAGMIAEDVGDGWVLRKSGTSGQTIYQWNAKKDLWDAVDGSNMTRIGGSSQTPLVMSGNGDGFFWR